MHFCSTMCWILLEPGALYSLSFLIALRMLSLVNMPFTFSGSGYTVAGMTGVSGGGERKCQQVLLLWQCFWMPWYHDHWGLWS